MCIDPLTEKYSYQSPYNFAENRVVDGRELEGLEWVDADGYTIYNTNKENGKVGYTDCATTEQKNLGNALKTTPTGTAQFDKLVNSNHPVEIIVNKTEERKVQGQPAFGATITPKLDNPDGKSTIEIFDKNISKAADQLEQNRTKGKTEIELPNGELLNISGLKKIDLLGAALGEEIEHTSDENIKLQNEGASKSKIEKKPSEISTQILKEAVNN